jgi:hypothetical protein
MLAQVVTMCLLGAGTWFASPWLFLGSARRSIVNKSEGELTLTWRFSPQGYEVTTPTSYARAEWSTIHRFLEGRTCFVLYVSEMLMHVIPKTALRPEDVPALRAMFTARITPRRRTFPFLALLLWVLIVLMLLAVWQFLQSDQPRPHP